MIDNENGAMHSNVPPIPIPIQPLSPNATLHESIVDEMQLEFNEFGFEETS